MKYTLRCMFRGKKFGFLIRDSRRILGKLSNPQLESILEKFLPKTFSKLLIQFGRRISKRIPNKLIPAVPPIFSNILGQWALEAGAPRAKLELWFKQAQKSSFSSKLGFAYESNLYLDSYGPEEYLELVANSMNSNKNLGERIENIRSYSMWNLDFNANYLVLSKLKETLEHLDALDEDEHFERFLPEFTSNMGHIGFLYFYVNYYNRIKEPRSIHIWEDIAPNKFFLRKVLEVANFDVVREPGVPPRSSDNLLKFDNLIYSRVSKGNWRFETNSAVYSGQFFPEFLKDNRVLLNLTDTESEKSYEKLKSIGLDPNRWIVALHVREPKSGHLSGIGQARDSDILSYRQFCEVVRDLGGQVVRMGDDRFPELPSRFPAIDYAHSNIRSEEVDVWLWGQSKWWTGNPSGALWPPITFNVPRLITNQWFWDPTGPEQDLYMPKLLYSVKRNRILNICETIQHPLSRCMNTILFQQEGLTLIENSPEDLLLAAVDMNRKINESGILSRNTLSETFSREFKITSKLNAMSVPDSFAAKYADFWE